MGKNKEKFFIKTSHISIGLAAFLVAGLGGCDGSNDSLATKQQKCKNKEYKEQHQDDCEDITRRFGSTSVNNTNANHSSGSSWVPMWMMMNSHSGYSYSSGNSTKSSGFVSGGSSSSGSSSGSSGG